MKVLTSMLSGIIVSLLLYSCGSSTTSEKTNALDGFFNKIKEATSTKYDTIEINNLYSIEIPDYMVSTTALNDKASLQYNNIYKEKYIIVVEDDREQIVKEFKESGIEFEDNEILVQFARAKENFLILGDQVVGEIDRNDLKAGNLAGKLVEFDSRVSGIPESITYYIAFIEGADHFYTVMAWTLSRRKKAYSAEVNKMLTSFKEL